MNRTRNADEAERLAAGAAPAGRSKRAARARKKTAPQAEVLQGPSPEFVPLAEVAIELCTTPRLLKRLAQRNRFAPILKVSNKHLLVRRADLEAWKAGRWSSAEGLRAEAVGDAVRQDPSNHRN